jgi:hypothetical protein
VEEEEEELVLFFFKYLSQWGIFERERESMSCQR